MYIKSCVYCVFVAAIPSDRFSEWGAYVWQYTPGGATVHKYTGCQGHLERLPQEVSKNYVTGWRETLCSLKGY